MICNCFVNWLINFLGRFCIGVYQGSQMTILRAYIGETTNHATAKLSPEKQKKSALKYTVFFITFLVGTVCNSFGPGVY